MSKKSDHDAKCDLVILPVAGLTGNFEPDYAGMRRIIEATVITQTGSKCKSICIIGGKTDRYPTGFAGAYAYAFRSFLPSNEEALAFYDAGATNSARDIEAALPKIDEFLKTKGFDRKTATIGVVSYPLHRQRIAVILRHFGFKKIVEYESRETPAYNLILDWLLLCLTYFDPTWRGWLGQLLNRWSTKLIEEPSKK
jgi:hypothetical protein